MSHKLTIDPGGANETVYDASKLQRVEFNKQHTAEGWWSAETPFDLSLEDRLGDEIHFEDGGEFLFRGRLLTTENTRAPSPQEPQETRFARLEGKDVTHDLTSGNAERRVTNTLVHDEIETVWSDLTSFSATVTDQTANTTVDDEQAQEANTDAEFNAILTSGNTGPGPTVPLAVQNGNVEPLKSCFFTEAENATRTTGGRGTAGAEDASFSRADGHALEDTGDIIEFDFALGYTIPSENVEAAVRMDDNPDTNFTTLPALEFSIILEDGTSQVVDTADLGTDIVLAWKQVGDGEFSAEDGWTAGDIPAGTHTLKIECTDGGAANQVAFFDCVTLHDGRFSYTFDNSIDGNNDLSGPELFPDSVELEFDVAPTTWSVNRATLSTTWDATSGNQRIQLQLPPDGAWGPSDGSEDNTDTITDFAFGSDAGTAIKGRARFGRFGTRTGTSPSTGFDGTDLQSWEITFDGDDIPVITDKTYEGSIYDILQDLHEEGRMHWTVEHAANAKNVESYPIDSQEKADQGLTVLKQTRSKSLEKGYANHVTVRAAKDSDGNRIKKTVEDATDIATFGKEHLEVKRPNVDTQTEVERLARQILRDRLTNAEIRGREEIVPKNVAPGYSYPVTWADGSTDIIPAELVSYEVRGGQLIGIIEYDLDPRTLGPRLSGTDGELRNTQLAF